MTATAETEVPAAKPSKMPLIAGLVLALVGGGGGFMAVQMGFIGGASDHAPVQEDDNHGVTQDAFAFVPLDPLVVSLPSDNGPRFLRFTAQLEVLPEFEDEVAALTPRIVDVLNGYLRAVTVAELEDPSSLIRFRAHMLRRIQVVVGLGKVRDLLIMEFVVN